VSNAHTGQKRFSFSWSEEVNSRGQKACSTIGLRILVGTLGTYPCLGYKNTFTIPGAKSRLSKLSLTLLRDEMARRKMVLSERIFS